MAAPQQKFRLGSEDVSVFENEGERGTYLNAVLNGRSYQDADKAWQKSHSYTAKQLAAHIALCQRTLNHMIDHESAKILD